MDTYNEYVNDYMNSYNCPDCNEANLQSDKNARKINEVIDQVNVLIQVNNETNDFVEDKVNEVVGRLEDKVNEVAGRLDEIKDITPEYIDVKRFGVIGDGLTDDTEAMQNALNHGGNLFVGAGTYLLSGELKFKSNTYLKGVYGKTIFQKKEAKYIRKEDGKERWTVLAQIGFNGNKNACENVTIENIIFDGNSGRESEQYIKPEYGDDQMGAKLIDVINANNITIKNVISRNNNYLGSAFTSCSDVYIENFKSLNCDVGICVFKDDNTDTELKNYTFKNILIDGHDMSEGISFYNKSYIKNVKVSDVTILNKEKGTAFMIGTEHDGEYGVIDGQFTNINIKNSSIGVAINQYSKNIQMNNINIQDCTRGLLLSGNSTNNAINNINIENIKTHGVYVGQNSNKNTIDNINISNCNTLLSTDYVGYIIMYGYENTFSNVNIYDSSNIKQYILNCRGSRNSINYSNIDKSSGTIEVYVNGENNKIFTNSSKFIKFHTPSANITNSITNSFTTTYSSDYVKGLSINNLNLIDTIYDKYKLNITGSVILENITLFDNFKKIYLNINVTGSNASLTLSNNGNIKWKSNDTFTLGKILNVELICFNNKWVELNRW